MKELSSTPAVWGTDGNAVAPHELPQADPGDAADFQHWLRAAPLPPSAHAASPSSLGEILRSASSALHEHERTFDKTLRRVARTGDPVHGLAVSRHLSELYISHGLAVKVIAKTTQGVETLMRLQ